MVRTIVRASSVAFCLTSFGQVSRADFMSLKNVAIEIPQSSATFPGGDEAEAINENCLTCHSTEMVLTQPALSKDQWGEEVTKMRKVFGAPVPDKSVDSIVAYLAALKPKK